MRRSPIDRKRQRWALNLAGILFVLAALSQAKVQIFQRGDILARAKETKRFIISRTEFAKRGAILSADGKALAQDDDTYEFSVRFDKVPNSDAFFMALGEAAEVPASDLRQAASSKVKSLTWHKAMSAAQATAVRGGPMACRSDARINGPTP
jgi:cell division protein FtsI/penicillin-binding protein 2